MTPEQEKVFEVFHEVAKDYGVGGDGRAKRMVAYLEPEVRRRLKAAAEQAAAARPAKKRAAPRRKPAASAQAGAK